MADQSPHAEQADPNRCRYCGVMLGQVHEEDCARPIPGVTVEPMSKEEERAVNDLLRRDALSPYEVTERQLQAIEQALIEMPEKMCNDTIQHVIDGIRAGAPPEPGEPDTAMADLNAELLDRLRVTQQQRDLLDRALGSYIERQAAEKAASGLITLATANAWANEQRLVIASAMQQIAPPQVQEDEA